MGAIQSVKISVWRTFLKEEGLTMEPGKGDHEKWTRPGLTRPVIFQTAIDPIPAPIILNNLRTLGISKTDFLKRIGKQG